MSFTTLRCALRGFKSSTRSLGPDLVKRQTGFPLADQLGDKSDRRQQVPAPELTEAAELKRIEAKTRRCPTDTGEGAQRSRANRPTGDVDGDDECSKWSNTRSKPRGKKPPAASLPRPFFTNARVQ